MMMPSGAYRAAPHVVARRHCRLVFSLGTIDSALRPLERRATSVLFTGCFFDEFAWPGKEGTDGAQSKRHVQEGN